MPRIIEERWMGIGFDIVTEQAQAVDPKDGQPLHDGKGNPKLEEVATLVLIVPLPDGQRIIRIPFNADAKQKLLGKLTGGLVIPNGAVI